MLPGFAELTIDDMSVTLNSTIFRNFRCGFFAPMLPGVAFCFRHTRLRNSRELAFDQYVSICEFPNLHF